MTTSHMTLRETAEEVGEHASGLLEMLQPWQQHSPRVSGACAQLTIALTRMAEALDRQREAA